MLAMKLDKDKSNEEKLQAVSDALLSQVVGSYHLMELHHFEPIIHNIIFEGLPQSKTRSNSVFFSHALAQRQDCILLMFIC